MGKMGPMSRVRNSNNNKNNSNNSNPSPKNVEVKENTVPVENIQEPEVKACTIPTDKPTEPTIGNKKFGAYSALVSSHDRVRKNAQKKTAKIASHNNKNSKSTTPKKAKSKSKRNSDINCINLKKQDTNNDDVKEIDVRDKEKLEQIILDGITKKYQEDGEFNFFGDFSQDSIMEKIDRMSEGKDIELGKDDLMDLINKKLDKDEIMKKIKVTSGDIKQELDNQANDIFEPDIDDQTEPDIDDTQEPDEPNVNKTDSKPDDDEADIDEPDNKIDVQEMDDTEDTNEEN